MFRVCNKQETEHESPNRDRDAVSEAVGCGQLGADSAPPDRRIWLAYGKPYVKRGKNDTTDAEAICEAVTRPNMRFVPVKSADQQAVLMLHRTRALLIRQQTMLANAFRAHLAEFGIVVPQGIRHVRALIERVFGEGADAIDLPDLVSRLRNSWS
jgi:transposase